ncbi:hypothetical protein KAR91_26795 [Candidatus Pacearchaeota archaeon]|nr:hypothetical protein [Candidatus Pacearchaeota archaeon]
MPTRRLRTRAGSVIARSNNYGVGKFIGGKIYVHRQYEDVIPDINLIKDYIKFSPRDLLSHPYNVVIYSRMGKRYSFVEAPNFDTAHEPTVGRITTFTLNGNSSYSRSLSSIYHHKWLFVKDDYTGFDVQESFDRSKEWTALGGIHYSRIGSPTYWATIRQRMRTRR